MTDKKYNVVIALLFLSYIFSGYLYVQNRTLREGLVSGTVSPPVAYSKPKPPLFKILFPTIKKINGNTLIVEVSLPRGLVEGSVNPSENVNLDDVILVSGEITIVPTTVFVGGVQADLRVGMSLRIVTKESFLEVKKLTAERIEFPAKTQ